MPGSGRRTKHVVVMGVSATGKTMVGEELAEELGCEFVEGDSLHPQRNIDKMSAGVPLTDEDRWPWLEAIAELVARKHRAGISTVVTCSALKRRYRDVLRDAAPMYFLHLERAVRRARAADAAAHQALHAHRAAALAGRRPGAARRRRGRRGRRRRRRRSTRWSRSRSTRCACTTPSERTGPITVATPGADPRPCAAWTTTHSSRCTTTSCAPTPRHRGPSRSPGTARCAW